MKSFSLALSFSLVLMATSLPLFALNTSLKGFIALNALDIQKIEHKNASSMIGIGVLDLKVFAEEDNMLAAMKLDLDGALAQDFNLFEEAYASYKGIPNFKFSLGKGVVKYQNLHWGVIQNTYLDGGSILGTENSWRKLARKAYISGTYGDRENGITDTIWIWGDSNEIQFDENGNPKTTTNSAGKITSYQTSNVKAFDTNKQLGLGHKMEINRYKDWTFTNGFILYNKKFAPHKLNWSMDFGANFLNSSYEFWSDLLLGYTAKAPYDSYTTYANKEIFFQIGGEKFLTEKYSLLFNAESVLNENQAWTYSSEASDDYQRKSGNKVKSLSYKFETGVKYKLSKMSFGTLGVLYEKKLNWLNGTPNLKSIPGVYNPNLNAFEFAGTVSFWF